MSGPGRKITRTVKVGQRFGFGVVTDPDVRINQSAAKPNGERAVKMRCICGNEYTARIYHLIDSVVRSCGCKYQAPGLAVAVLANAPEEFLHGNPAAEAVRYVRWLEARGG